uniref:Uncharacterized protein n=1 Tax=Mycena chlorophos TaxID=658473 RepID=A0ABQ0L461_MYCCL|nr:predicted protein [Mycena chlorophos]
MQRTTRLTRYLRDLAFRGDRPATLALGLSAPREISLSDVLQRTNVSVDEFAIARRAIWAPNVEQARVERPSRWLAVYLLAFKVHTPTHASGPALTIALDAPTEEQAPLLVISMIHMARFSILTPMQSVVEAFLAAPSSPLDGVHFNHILLATTTIHSPQSRVFAVQILTAMEQRSIRLWDRTATAMMSDHHSTLKLAPYLRRRAWRVQTPHTASQLLVLLRNAAFHRNLRLAEKYFHAIRGSMPAADKLSAVKRDIRAHRINTARTQLIRSRRTFNQAARYLNLVLLERATREKPFVRVPFNHPRNLLGKRAVDIRDWNAVFAIGAADHRTVTPRRMVGVFKRMRAPFIEHLATAATYRILIRGLLERDELEAAYEFWIAFLQTGQPLTASLFAEGLLATALTRRTHEVVALLELYGRKGSLSLRSTVKLTPPLINVVMSAFVEILRPDLVFRLWDSMEALYQLRPSPGTLRILLRAAQLPHLLDDSFSGQMALLASKNPFRRRPTNDEDRKAVLKSLNGHAATQYRSGVWHGHSATEAASQVFYEVGLGGHVGMQDLLELDVPALAVRPHAESGRVVYSTPLPLLDEDATSPTTTPLLNHIPPLAPPTAAELNMHEHIWAEYILLLGMTRRAPEIARVLVWMRALGVEPRRKTVGIALGFWVEVSVQAPFIAAIAGERGDEYQRLVRWLEGWLGLESIPGDEESEQ